MTVRANPDEPMSLAPLDKLGESEQRQLAERLREARRHVGLLQLDVASVLGLSRSTVSAIERGTRRIQPLELRRMARLYRRPVRWFVDAAEVSESLHRNTMDLTKTDKLRMLRSAEVWVSTAQP